MMKSVLILYCLSLCLVSAAQKNLTSGGKLFIIGGGHRSDALMQQMVKTANLGPKDYIIVLPMASEQPDTGFLYFRGQMEKLTQAPVIQYNYNLHNVNDRKWNDSLVHARLIYILGGDQNRFMSSVLHTPVYAAIHKAFKGGATIAGTSAGAAVMSKHMITGRQKQDSNNKYKETFDRLYADNVEFTEGLGLLQGTIIDQHFVKRSRYSRLISALADKPGYDCIGIDEGTAIIVHGNHATVAGDSQVLQFNNNDGFSKTQKGQLKFRKLMIAAFVAGERFTLQP